MRVRYVCYKQIYKVGQDLCVCQEEAERLWQVTQLQETENAASVSNWLQPTHSGQTQLMATNHRWTSGWWWGVSNASFSIIFHLIRGV